MRVLRGDCNHITRVPCLARLLLYFPIYFCPLFTTYYIPGTLLLIGATAASGEEALFVDLESLSCLFSLSSRELRFIDENVGPQARCVSCPKIQKCSAAGGPQVLSEATQSGHQLRSQPCRASLQPCLHRPCITRLSLYWGDPGHRDRCGFLTEGAGE